MHKLAANIDIVFSLSMDTRFPLSCFKSSESTDKLSEFVSLYTHTNTHTHTHTYIYIYMYMCVCVFTNARVCVCVCVCGGGGGGWDLVRCLYGEVHLPYFGRSSSANRDLLVEVT